MSNPEPSNYHEQLMEAMMKEMSQPIYSRIMTNLGTSDDMFSVVIKGMVIIDELIEIGLARRISNWDALKPFLPSRTNERIKIFNKLYSPQDPSILTEALHSLKRLRNSYAHSLAEDDAKAESLARAFIAKTEQVVNIKVKHAPIEHQVRLCILYLSWRVGAIFHAAGILRIPTGKDIYGGPLPTQSNS